MTVLGHAYPWDVLGDPGFVRRVRELGLDGVNLAAAYHTTRAGTPWHPDHVVVDARHAAFYRPVRPQAWTGLRPASPEWLDVRDSFGAAATALAEAGIPVHAWIVLTHNSFLGRAHPGFAVRNCFGDSYPYALCVSHPEVREYAETLVAETVRDLPLAGVCLEACGQLGFDHGGHHEKTDGVFAPDQRRLLSLCCCPACLGDRDPAELRQAVREGFREDFRQVRALRPALAGELLAVRSAATDELRAAVVAAAPGMRVTLHGDPDPWATGPLPGLTQAAVKAADAVVVQCWQPGEAALRRVTRTRELVGAEARVGGFVTVLPPAIPTPDDDLVEHVRALAAAGADELHLYHLGLAGPARFPLLADAVRVFRESR